VKTLVGILIISVLALAGHRRSFTRILPFRRQPLFLTGTEFILVGFVLGDAFLGVLDPPTLASLYPFLILGLGWIGLLTGIQLEWKGLRLFPLSSYGWVLCLAACTFLLIYSGLYLLLHPWFSPEPRFRSAVALLSVAGLCSGQTTLALWMMHAREADRLRGQVLGFAASMHDVIAVALFGILVCSVPAPTAWPAFPALPWERLLASVLLGVLMGVLFTALFRTRLGEAEKIIVVSGLLLFCGGISRLLGLSPLFVAAVSGVFLANFSWNREETFQLLVRIERPLYLIFLIVAGAYLTLELWPMLIFVASYCVVRALAKGVGGGLILGSTFPKACHARRMRMGWGLISQGGVAVALAINFRLWFLDQQPTLLFKTTFAVIVISIWINELFSPFGLRAAMKEA